MTLAMTKDLLRASRDVAFRDGVLGMQFHYYRESKQGRAGNHILDGLS